MKQILMFSVSAILITLAILTPSAMASTGNAPATASDKCPDEKTLTREARTALVEAQKLMSEDKMTDARKTLEAFVREHPEESHAYVTYTMAGLYLEQGKMAAAMDQYEKTIGFCPAYAPAWQNLGKVCYDLKKYARAATALEKTWALTGKTNHTLRFHAAAAHISDNAPQKALPILEFLCSGQAGPPDDTWVKLLVQLSIEQKRSENAVKTVERLLAQPDPKPYLFRLATSLYLDLCLYKKAAQTLNAYGLMKPLKPAEQTLLADLYNNLGIPAKAAENYEKSLALKPSRRLHERVASAWFEACEHDKALAAAQKGLDAHPDSYDLWKLTGWVHYEHKAFEDASRAFQKAANLNKKDTKSLFMHGLSACRAGDRDVAKKALEQAACNDHFKAQAQTLIRQMETSAENI